MLVGKNKHRRSLKTISIKLQFYNFDQNKMWTIIEQYIYIYITVWPNNERSLL